MRWLYAPYLAACLFMVTSSLAAEKIAPAKAGVAAGDRVFEGPWVTTNRRLDGIMTAIVKDLGEDQWQGRFYGVWQGVPFDYTVRFTGNPDAFKGTANIDQADYTWTGKIEKGSDDEPAVFKATFGGNRYKGYFNMKEKQKGERIAAVPPGAATR